MKLSDYKTGFDQPSTFLFTGHTGSGKTVAAGSFARILGEIKKTMYVFDFDSRIAPLAVHYPERLGLIEFDPYPKKGMSAFKSKIESFVNQGCPFDVILFDSITFLARSAVGHMIDSRERAGKVLGGWRVSDIEDYGGETAVLMQLLDAVQMLKMRHGKTVIVTAHLLPPDPNASDLARVVTGGKSIAPVIPGAFDNVFYFSTKRKTLDGPSERVVQTTSSDIYMARNIFGLPQELIWTGKDFFQIMSENVNKNPIIIK